MRKNLLNLSILAIGTLFFASCTKKTDNSTAIAPSYDNHFTINGGVFKNTTVNFKTVSADSGTYNTSQNMTSIIVAGSSGDSLTLAYAITVPGSKAGSVTLNTGGMLLQTNNNAGSNPLIYVADPSTVVDITSYGNVGGHIAGTFSGTFNENGADIYSITGGTFSVKRTANQ